MVASQRFPIPLRIRKVAGRGGGAGGGDEGDQRARAALEREALLRVAEAASAANDLDSVLELAAEEARRGIGAASLSISRLEGDGRHYRTLINVGDLGPDEERYPTNEIYDVEEFPRLAEMMRTGKPFYNSLDDPDCDPAAAALLRRLGKASDLGVPIEVEGRHWGEVWATTVAATSPFRAGDIHFLEAVGGQLAIAIARAELFSKVSRLAYEDQLTGLANRRAFDERLERAVARMAADGTSLELLLCDVDRLKAINDAHGHLAGDRALQAVARALVAAAAELPGAFVARLAGDEFCVLLESREPGALEKVGVIAQGLLAGEEVEVTVSCGAATAEPGPRAATQLLRAADAAQYVAKRRGGNRVCTAAHVAEEEETGEIFQPLGTATERIRAASAEVVRRLDEELAEAPVLDRLETVATAYAEAGDFARWSISFAASGRSDLRDISLGENRQRRGIGARVAVDAEQYEHYELDDYPATARIVNAGTGSFVARVGDESSDPAERKLLEKEGFVGIAAAAIGVPEGAYLIELVTDDPAGPLDEAEPALSLAVRAAGRPHPHRRGGPAPLSTAHARALQLTLALADRLAEATTEDEVCEGAVEELHATFGCPIVHLVAVRGDHFEMRAERGPIPTPEGWSQRVDAGLLGRCLEEGRPVLSGEVAREPQFRATVANRNVHSELAAPISVGGEPWGVINLEDTEGEAFSADDAGVLEAASAQIGGALNAIGLYESLDRAYVGTAEALSAALEAKDHYTAEHSRSIVEHAVGVGSRMGVAGDELRMLRYAAAFHDIGKLVIPGRILNKAESLSESERREIDQHTLAGERILGPIEFLAPIRPLVRGAHERWDGRGYPDALAGEAIPLGARIIFACDAYDAMTTDRPYRVALAEEAAREELRRGSGSQFDPDVVEALLAVLAEA